MKRLTYADSGVDIRAEERAISAMKRVMTGRRKGIGAPLTEIGHYAGLIDMGEYASAMTTDGVGSKVLIASAMRKWDTVGIDCMAIREADVSLPAKQRCWQIMEDVYLKVIEILTTYGISTFPSGRFAR